MFSTRFVFLATHIALFVTKRQYVMSYDVMTCMNSRISSDPTVFSGRGGEAETIRGRVDHALHGRSRGGFSRVEPFLHVDTRHVY